LSERSASSAQTRSTLRPPPQQQQGAPKRPWGPNPMELTTKMTPTHSYLFSILLTWKAISLPRDHSPGLLVSTI